MPRRAAPSPSCASRTYPPRRAPTPSGSCWSTGSACGRKRWSTRSTATSARSSCSADRRATAPATPRPTSITRASSGPTARCSRSFTRPRRSTCSRPSTLPHRLRYLLRASAAFREARENARRLARVQRLAGLAQFELEVASGAFRWSEEAHAIFGIEDAGQVLGIEGLLRWVHSDDRETVARLLAVPAGHRIEYRLVMPDGRERKVHQEAELIVDEIDGKTRLVGGAQDVTELRAAERQVRTLANFDPITRLPNRAFLRK